MKTKFSKALLIGFALGPVAALANSVEVHEDSHDTMLPTVVTYKNVHQDEGSGPVMSGIHTLKLDSKKPSKKLDFELDNHKYAGIQIISVNTHLIHDADNQFGKPGCSLATDKDHQSGHIYLTIKDNAIECATKGGVHF